MKLFRLSAAVAALWILARFLPAQVPVGYVQVSAANLTDSSGVKIANGTIAFAPVNNAGQPISYQINGNGQSHSLPVTTLVTNGAMAIQLADTALTIPVNVCFSVTITDNTNGNSMLGPGYTCFQPAGSGPQVASGLCTATTSTAGGTCNFDKFQPNLPGLVVQQTGPTGPAPNMAVGSTTTMAPGSSATVSIDGTNPNYNLHFGIPQGVVGPTGATGATGPMGPTGPLGPTGPPGGSLSYPGCTSDGSNGFQCPTGNVAGAQVGGVAYAKQAQTGSGANGIVNAVANNTAVFSDPGYMITTTANIVAGSSTITVANPAGIVAGQFVSGSGTISQNAKVLSVAGNIVTLTGGWALTTNASATVNFFEMPFIAGNGNYPNASLSLFQDKKLGFVANVSRDWAYNPFTQYMAALDNECVNTKNQSWVNGSSAVGAHLMCHHEYAWYAAPGTDYGQTGGAGYHGLSNWTVTSTYSFGDLASTQGISEELNGIHVKAGIGDSPYSYQYYADYLGAVAGADEGQGGEFIGGGEATNTYTGTVSAGGTGATRLSVNCLTDCAAVPNLFYGGPGDGRYVVDKTNPFPFNMTAFSTPATGVQGVGTITTDVVVPVSTFFGQIGTPVSGNTNGTITISGLSTTTGFAVGSYIVGPGIPNMAYVTSINTGASSLTISAAATATASGVSLIIGGDVQTPSGVANSSGIPFSDATTPMTFTVSSGTLAVPYALASASAASGGTTTYGEGGQINANLPGICANPGVTTWVVTGFTNANNNGTFTCASTSSVSTLVLNNPNGVAETHAGVATLQLPNSGAPAAGDLVCFSWPFHEQASISSVTGSGPWQVTVPLRKSHTAGSWMFSGGTCGSFADFTANQVAANSGSPLVLLRYPFDVIGSLDSHTLAYVFYNYLSANAGYPGAFSLGNITMPYPVGGATNINGQVTLGNNIASSSAPWLFNQPKLTFTGSADPNYNGTCLNSVTDGAGHLQCFEATNTSTTATTGLYAAVGSTGYGNTAGVLLKGAEMLDIVDYSETNCAATNAKHAPCFDSKNLVLEPNNAAWSTATAATTANFANLSPVITVANAAGIVPGQALIGVSTNVIPANTSVVSVAGTSVTLSANATGNNGGVAVTFAEAVEEPHHYAAEIRAGKNLFIYQNPMHLLGTHGYTMILGGMGINGGCVGNGSLGCANWPMDWASFAVENGNPGSWYMYHGGTQSAPGGIKLSSQGAGSSQPGVGYAYGLKMDAAPEPAGAAAVYVGCPSLPWGCTDRAYKYYLFAAGGNLNQNGISNGVVFNPLWSEMSFGDGSGRPIYWAGEFNGVTDRDSITFAPMTTPVPTPVAVSTGGGLVGGSFTLNQAAPSGSTTVYTATGSLSGVSCPASPLTTFTITGFTNAGNNGTFTCASVTSTTLTLNNASGVAETPGSGTQTATYAYCYIMVGRGAGQSVFSAPSSSVCAPVPTSGNQNSVKITWPRTSGAVYYYICGRSLGATNQITFNGGVDWTTYTDAGLPVSGVCPIFTATQNGGIDQAGEVGLNSFGTANAALIKAPAGLGAGINLTTPSVTGTLALTSQITPVRAGAWTITSATSVGVTFATAFPSTPASCALTPTSDPTAIGAIWMTALTTTGMTVNVHTSGTISGTYQCVGGSTTRRRPTRHPAPRPPARPAAKPPSPTQQRR